VSENLAIRPDGEDDRFRQLTIVDLELREGFGEPWIVDGDLLQVACDVGAHRDCLSRDPFLLLAVNVLGDGRRVLEHSPCPVRKPEFEAALEQERSEDGDENSRDGGNCGKESHKADVQTSASEAALLGPAHRDFPRIERHERDRRQEDRDQQQGDERR